MTPRLIALAVCGACLLATPTQAQEAEAAGGPLRFSGGASDMLNFVVGPLPATPPTTPVEVWEWTMYRNDRTAGDMSFDAAAYRVRIDCGTGARQVLAAELFKDGGHLFRLVASAATEPSPPGTLYYNTVRMACEPGYHLVVRETPPDHRAARTLADRYFAANP